MSSFKRVWTDMHIHIHIYIYFSTPGIQKMGKLPNFGVDMFFLKLLESKKWKKILVLVLTDWNLEPSAYTRIEGKIWKCKVAPKNNVFFQKGLNRHAYTHTYIYFSTPGIQKMGKMPNFWCWHVFSQTPGIQKMEKILVLVLTCFSQTPGVQKMGKLIY